MFNRLPALTTCLTVSTPRLVSRRPTSVACRFLIELLELAYLVLWNLKPAVLRFWRIFEFLKDGLDALLTWVGEMAPLGVVVLLSCLRPLQGLIRRFYYDCYDAFVF